MVMGAGVMLGGGVKLGIAPNIVPSDVPFEIGPVDIEYDTVDANAEHLKVSYPAASATQVPVLSVGIGIRDVDLTWWNGETQPRIAVVDTDRDSAISLGWAADDVPEINWYGSAGNLRMYRAGNVVDIQNTTDGASNQVAILRGGNRGTPTDDDEAYISLTLDDSDGAQAEFARITWIARDVTSNNKDGQIEFSVQTADALTPILTIDSSAAGALLSTFQTGDVIFNDNVSIQLGTAGAESDLSSNGTNTIWNMKSGNLTVQHAGAGGLQYTAGALAFQEGTTLSTTTGNLSIDAAAGSAIRLNDARANVDVVWETEAGNNGLVLDAEDGTAAFGTTASDRYALTIGTTITGSTGNSGLLRTTGTVNALVGQYAFGIRAGGTFVEAGSGTHPVFASLYVQPPAVTNGDGSTTAAASLYIQDAPSSVATNDYALFVAAGTSRLDGGVTISGTLDNGGSAVTFGDDIDFDAAAEISASGDLTLSAAAGSDVLIGDGTAILEVNGTRDGIGLGGSAGSESKVNLGGTQVGTEDSNMYGILVSNALSFTEFSAGNHTRVAALAMFAPTVNVGDATVTNTSMIYVHSAMSATVTGDNYSIWVAGGPVRFDGDFGACGVVPQAQQAHIVDADGTLADITTKFNTLLADIEGFGFLANA